MSHCIFYLFNEVAEQVAEALKDKGQEFSEEERSVLKEIYDGSPLVKQGIFSAAELIKMIRNQGRPAYDENRGMSLREQLYMFVTQGTIPATTA